MHMTKSNVSVDSNVSLDLLTVVYYWSSLQVCWLAFDSTVDPH